MTVEQGSIWTSIDGKLFQVISAINLDGNDWVYYRLIDKEEAEIKEFSCYEESFITRFRKLPES